MSASSLTPEGRSALRDAAARLLGELRNELSRPDDRSGLWWLSYADDDEALGVAVVAAPGFLTACLRAMDLGVDPGGTVRGWPLGLTEVPEYFRDRLLGLGDLLELEAVLGGPAAGAGR